MRHWRIKSRTDTPDFIPAPGSSSDDTIYPPPPALTRTKRARPSDFDNYDTNYVNGAHRYHEGPLSIHDVNEQELLKQFEPDDIFPK